jgi:hypothetical protein
VERKRPPLSKIKNNDMKPNTVPRNIDRWLFEKNHCSDFFAGYCSINRLVHVFAEG